MPASKRKPVKVQRKPVKVQRRARQSNKPTYRVPTMDEIRQIPWNGYTVASTFAGGGGSSTGYRMAGYRVAYANEFVDAARETYEANKAPYTVTDGRDIRSVTVDEFLNKIGMEAGQLDVLDGSPPCASFSTAGSRHAKWGKVNKYSDTSQRTDDLFFEYARLIDGVRPRVFVAENVSGLVKGTAKGYFRNILAALKDCGYDVSARLLDASYLGVPQSRQRLIFVGVRNDLGLPPAHPAPLPYRYTLREVLPHVTGRGGGTDGGGYTGNAVLTTSDRPGGTIGASPQTGNGRAPAGFISVDEIVHRTRTEGVQTLSLDRPARTVTATGISNVSDIDHLLGGRLSVFHETSGAFSSGDVTDKPSPAVTVGANSVNSVHYQVKEGDGDQYTAQWRDGEAYDPETGERVTIRTGPLVRAYPHLTLRKFTLGELRAVCGFPPDFVLTGSYAQRWERMGRSVPPLMMKHIAETVAREVLDKCAD